MRLLRPYGLAMTDYPILQKSYFCYTIRLINNPVNCGSPVLPAARSSQTRETAFFYLTIGPVRLY